MGAQRWGVFLLSLAGLGCGLLDSGTDSFVIRVDSISAPAAIAPADTLTVRFFGGIGPDLCSRLVRVEKRSEPGVLEVRFHGERDEGGGDCLQMVSLLDHEEKILPPLVDPFIIRVLQPEGAPLERVVGVQ
jgi:hypothetical protein